MVIASKDVALLTGQVAKRIMRLAEKAHTPGEFKELMDLISGEAEVEWRPFGWDGSNDGGRVPHSALGAAPDPMHLMVEPVMNSFDALFELEMGLRELGSAPLIDPRSPREAAHVLFGVHSDGMAAWDVRKGDERKHYEDLARLTLVKLLAGSRAATPTVMFRDQGIGQHPTDFWRTILSLQLGNKADVPYTAGQYGHGAGMLLAFTVGGQVMISRRHPKLLKDGQDDYAGLVLVRKQKPSEVGRVQPHYACLVSKATSKPFAFSPQALTDPSWHGLQRTCIDYELPQHSFQALYDAFDHFLSNPPLPYELLDERNA
jgi:hypothetical protein